MAENIDEKNETKVNLTKQSFQEICDILNKRRPYRSSDSKKQHFFPDLIIALLITINFMGTPVQPKQNKTENKQNSAAVAKQYQNQMNCVNYFAGMQKVR